ENSAPHFLVAHADTESVGFSKRGAFLHELLENLLLDAQLLQQLLAHIRAVGGAVGLQLRLVRAPEFAGADLPALDARNRVARRGVGSSAPQEIGNVKNDECEAYQTQAPLQPTLVPPHLVEHRHRWI